MKSAYKNILAGMACALGLLFSVTQAKAQIYISEDLFYSDSKVTLTVLDSLSRKPMEFASVFLVPKGDSTISHFTLTDSTGVARLEKVTRQSYLACVQMMGYVTWQKEFFPRSDNVDLGKVFLAPDLDAIRAARVTEYVDAVVMKQDTVEYNMAAFGVAESDMLKDVLRRMPGIEVSDDGDVKVGGESIKKITVGGKDFFFNDKTTALNNLPAKIIEKIKVIDKKSDEAEFNGLAEMEKERVMDLQLKEEYRKGGFGNIGGMIGSGLSRGDDKQLRSRKGLLYRANALGALYGEKTQVTLVANASNVADPNGLALFMMDADGNDVTPGGGLTSSRVAGINLNTDGIPKTELDANFKYDGNHKDFATRSSRTTVTGEGSHAGHTLSEGASDHNGLTLQAGIENKDRSKVFVDMGASFNIGAGSSQNEGRTEQYMNSELVGMSSSSRLSSSRSWNLSVNGNVGIRDLGKEWRALSFNAWITAGGSRSGEWNRTDYAGGDNSFDLFYDGSSGRQSYMGGFAYIEPLGEHWRFAANFSGRGSFSSNVRSAFGKDDGGEYSLADAWYSSSQNTRDREFESKVMMQWSKDRNMAEFGVSAITSNFETTALRHGEQIVSGEGEWSNNFAPYLNLSLSKGDHSFWAWVNSRTANPQRSRMLPVLNIGESSVMSVGNIYLRRSFNNRLAMSYRYYRPDKGISVMTYPSLSLDTSPTVEATWFDGGGMRYAVPVNSRKPGLSASMYSHISFPLDRKKMLTLTINIAPNWSRRTGYQADGVLEGIDRDNFSYDEFFDSFWGGDDKGGRFFSGESGFRESLSHAVGGSAGASLNFRKESFHMNVGYDANVTMNFYSLDRSADNTIHSHSFNARVQYVTPHGFDLSTDGSYTFYRGYSMDFGRPSYIWNANFSKAWKAFTFSLTVQDILDSRRSFLRSEGASWYQESYSLVLGRHFLAGVKWNFGKLNSSNQSRANNAALNMAF